MLHINQIDYLAIHHLKVNGIRLALVSKLAFVFIALKIASYCSNVKPFDL